MRDHRTRLTALVAAIALGLLLSACAPAGQPAQPAEKGATPAAKEKPQYGGTYRTTTSNPRIGQDPVRTTGSSHFSNFGRAYSNLLRFKMSPDISESTFIIAPDLAERWENPTPTTWIFYLRKGVKWHNIPPVNGREFVADDVVYSINRLAGQGSAQVGYWLDLEKVEALDKYIVKFTLKNPVAPFLTIVAFGFNKMTAKEAVEAGGGNLDNGPLIGTGAWFVTCTVDVECILKRNPEYYLKDEDGNQLPYMDGLRQTVMPDVQAQFAAFRAKQLDIRTLLAEERQIIERAHPEVVIKEVRLVDGNQIHFRGDRAPWNDERVRMAASKAIDRHELIETIWGGKGWYTLLWANPAADWYLSQDEFKQAYQQDIPLAKKLLAEAGYPNGFDASMWVANYSAEYIALGELVASQLAKAGIRVKINVHDQPVYLSQVFIRQGKFEDMALGPTGSFLEPDLWLSAYFHSKGGRNSSYVNDPKLDQMIEAQRREMNPEKRKQLILEIQRYLLQKNYNLVIRSYVFDNGWWPWVKNRSFSASSDYPGSREAEYIWIDQEMKKKMGAPE